MISILIPVFNYPVHDLVFRIREMAQRENIDYEILVADDASTNSSFLEQNLFLNQLENCSYFKFEVNKGRTATTHYLVEKAQYDHLLFLDADVLPTKEDFLKIILKNLSKAPVLFGGITYPLVNSDPDSKLRFVYGHKRESRPLELRIQQPYRSITLAAVAITKKVFKEIEMPLTNLYGLDIYFSYRLKQLQTEVIHLDNPVIHMGIETTSEFLSKTQDGLKTMVMLEKNKYVASHYRPLQVVASRFEKLKMTNSYIQLFKRIEPQALKNLHSQSPSLKIFDAWRLYHFLKLRNEAS